MFYNDDNGALPLQDDPPPPPSFTLRLVCFCMFSLLEFRLPTLWLYLASVCICTIVHNQSNKTKTKTKLSSRGWIPKRFQE